MQHHFDWGLPVAIDLFAAALGAGAFMLAAVADLAGGRKYRTTSFVGALIAPWPAIAGVLLLVIDLGHPFRFWEMLLKASPEGGIEAPYLMFSASSTMSIGTWVLTVFVWMSLAYIVCHIASYPYRFMTYPRKLVAVLGIPIAMMVTIYTGVLLAASSNDVWANWALPIVFLASAMVTGIAAVILALALLRMCGVIKEDADQIPILERYASRIILVQIVAMAAFLLSGIGSPGMATLLSARLSTIVWTLVVGLGLAVPLLMTVKGKLWPPVAMVVTAMLIVQGGLCLRYVLRVESEVRPIVFITTVMATGAALEVFVLSFLRMIGRVDENNERVRLLERVTNRIMLLQFAVVAIFVLAAGSAAQPMADAFDAHLAASLWVLVFGLGLVVPLLITFKGRTWSPVTSLVTALLILEGGFFLRYVLLMIGQVA